MQPSRTPSLDMQKIVENVGGNKFDLIIYGAALARSISKKHKGSVEYINPTMNALLEIQENKYAGKKV